MAIYMANLYGNIFFCKKNDKQYAFITYTENKFQLLGLTCAVVFPPNMF